MSNPYGGGTNPYGQNPYGAGQPAQPQQNQYAQQPPAQPGYQAPPQQPGTFTCPKCKGVMRTYNRNAIQIEQCDNCRGVFLDFGELEGIIRLEGSFTQAPPPPAYGGHAPGWNSHGSHHYRSSGFSRLFFST